jgi:hypothetical protein
MLAGETRRMRATRSSSSLASSAAAPEFAAVTPSSDPLKAGPVLFTAHSSKDSESIEQAYRYLMQPNLLNR